MSAEIKCWLVDLADGISLTVWSATQQEAIAEAQRIIAAEE